LWSSASDEYANAEAGSSFKATSSNYMYRSFACGACGLINQEERHFESSNLVSILCLATVTGDIVSRSKNRRSRF